MGSHQQLLRRLSLWRSRLSVIRQSLARHHFLLKKEMETSNLSLVSRYLFSFNYSFGWKLHVFLFSFYQHELIFRCGLEGQLMQDRERKRSSQMNNCIGFPFQDFIINDV